MQMKSYTDLEQARFLAGILSPETADMHYNNLSVKGVNYVDPFHADLMSYKDAVETLCDYEKANPLFEVIPCWSLAALLDVLQIYTTPTAFSTNISAPSLTKTKNGYSITYVGDYRIMESNNNDIESPIEIIADNPIDACYEMILKLHELKML